MIRHVPVPMLAPTMAVAAGGASGAMLVAALGSQYIGGLEPCVLCIVQRWPHLVALLAGAWAWARRGRCDSNAAMALGLMAAIAAVLTAGFHTGVELGLWSYGCGLPDWSDPEAVAALAKGAPPDCSVPAWTFLGHSMAAWNTLASAALSGLWGGAFWRAIGRAGGPPPPARP